MKLEDFGFFTFIVVLFVGVFTFILQIAEASDHNECHENGNLINIQVTYRKWDGCYVNQNNLWVPYGIWLYNRDHGFVVK